MSFYACPKRQNALLQEWHGSYAELLLFGPEHRRMVFGLHHPEKERDIYLLAVSCQHYCGPLRWTDSRLELEKFIALDVLNCTIRDRNGQVEILCGDAALYTCESAQLTFENLKPMDGQLLESDGES